MRPVRLVALLLGALLVGQCGRPADERPPTPAELEARADAVRARAARWLWNQQAADGGWHSATYGLLRSGQSLTPFVLDALLTVPESLVPRGADRVRSALVFCVSHVAPSGALGLSDPAVSDYPTYATALALPLVRRNIDRTALGDRMRDWLLGHQFKRATGWSEAHPAFGAWGMGTEVRPPQPGHLDLSMTRHALEALAQERGSDVRKARARALVFLERLEARQGGYFFSTVLTDKNKAGADGEGSFRAYGTTTADALLALHAAGVPKEDVRRRRAMAWLVAHHEVARVPGLPPKGGWAESMRFYYLAAAARAFAAQGITEAPAGRDWRRDMIEALGAAQKPDGSFRNDGTLMKEDDPLLATTLVIRAIADLRF